MKERCVFGFVTEGLDGKGRGELDCGCEPPLCS
jgi:hypothetical protein